MGGFRELGRKYMRSRTGKSYWQQDIRHKEYAAAVLKATGLTVVISWLFYRSFWSLAPLVPLWIWYYHNWKIGRLHKKEQEFLLQFKEMIQVLSASLNTGYSVENAVKESQKELAVIYNEDTAILRELGIMIRQIRMNIPAEQALTEFSDRVAQEDVRNFVTVFVTAKKTGGDMIDIIRNASGQIADKIDVKREIETILAAKRYEFQVMSVIPFAIIGYMSLCFPEFMDNLYGNIIGNGVMTVCLALYIGAYYLGERIIQIEV